MTDLRGIAATLGVVAFGIATPAAAVVKIATYTGVIVSGYDQTGVFTTPGTQLDGLGYAVSYTYDKTLGTIDADGHSYEQSYGDATGSPIITAEIIINGVSRHIMGDSYSVVYTSSYPFVEHEADDFFYDGRIYSNHFVHNNAYPDGAPALLDQNFAPAVSSDGYGYAYFNVYDYTTSSQVELAYAYLGTESLYSVSGTGPVPEPASWALMIAGFGMVGAAQRRMLRRRAVAATA